jgi:hypothetical protein
METFGPQRRMIVRYLGKHRYAVIDQQTGVTVAESNSYTQAKYAGLVYVEDHWPPDARPVED